MSRFRIRIAQDSNAFELTLTETGGVSLVEQYFGSWLSDDGQKGHAGWLQSDNPDYNFWHFDGGNFGIGANWPDQGGGTEEGQRLITSALFLFNGVRNAEGNYEAVGHVGVGRMVHNGTLRFDLARSVQWQARHFVPGSNHLNGVWRIGPDSDA